MWFFLPFDVGGYAYGDGAGGDGLGGEAHGSEHGVFAYIGSGEDGGVVGDAGVGSQFGAFVGDIGLVVDVVGVGVDVGVVGDAGALVEDDLALVSFGTGHPSQLGTWVGRAVRSATDPSRRIVVLNLGAVIADDVPDVVRSDAAVGAAYLG